jgi:hypothetical protein
MTELQGVEASFNYLVPTGETPVTYLYEPSKAEALRKGVYAPHMLSVSNARPMAARLSLDAEGFALTRHDSALSTFADETAIKSVYYPEMEKLVKRVTGATRVLVFDHTLRANSPAGRAALKGREPVRVVHNDYTPRSGPQRIRDLLPAEAEALLRRRYAFINVWKPIKGPVEEAPLAACDARTIAAQDWVATELRYPDRTGEVYSVAFNPSHRWYYFPRMALDEALLIKCYDSAEDGRARFAAHSAFDDPTSPPGAPHRESIEIRTIAFFAA